FGDAADDDGVYSEDARDLSGGGRIGPIAIREVLLFQYLIQFLPLDDGEDAVLHQAVDENVGYALADVLIGTKPGVHITVHGGIVEIHDGHALLGLSVGHMKRS